MTGDGEGVEVDDGDEVIGGAGDEGAVAGGFDEDAGGAAAEVELLDGLAGVGVEDGEGGAAEG